MSFTANSGTVTLAGLSGGGSTSFAAGAVFPTLSAGSVTVAGRAWITTASGGTATLNGPSDTIGTLSGAVITAAGTGLDHHGQRRHGHLPQWLKHNDRHARPRAGLNAAGMMRITTKATRAGAASLRGSDRESARWVAAA